jgi:hypothetical protein
MFLPEGTSHSVGRGVPSETPAALAPRNDGQFGVGEAASPAGVARQANAIMMENAVPKRTDVVICVAP